MARKKVMTSWCTPDYHVALDCDEQLKHKLRGLMLDVHIHRDSRKYPLQAMLSVGMTSLWLSSRAIVAFNEPVRFEIVGCCGPELEEQEKQIGKYIGTYITGKITKAFKACIGAK